MKRPFTLTSLAPSRGLLRAAVSGTLGALFALAGHAGADVVPPGTECCGKFIDQGEPAAPVLQAQRVSAHSAAARALSAPSVASALAAPMSFTNSTSISIDDCPNPCPASGHAASLYPSPITVSGVPGKVERVSVTFNGLSHAFPADIDILLVSPSGRKAVIMSDGGAGSPGVSNINVTLDDYADAPIPSTVTGNTGKPFVTGTYRPFNSGTTDLFPSPAPAGPYNYTLSAFNGDDPNGVWSLYIIDDANLDGGVMSGGWTISFDSRPTPPQQGDVLISQFRTRGAGTTPPGSDGSADEFIELYNNTDSSITIIDSIPGADPTAANGAGWRLSVAQGASEVAFYQISQTISTAGPLAIPPRGHFLISTQPTTPSPSGNTYSLATYPTGTGITASGSANLTINPASATVGLLPDDAGLAIYSTSSAISADRLDSVGYSSVTSTDHKEGTGLAPAGGITTAGQQAWVRKISKAGVQDTGDNAADFTLVDTTAATLNGVAAVLGAPGPERAPTATANTTTSAPIHAPNANNMTIDVVDPMQTVGGAPNAVYNSTAVTNGANGTIKLRAKVTNNSGVGLLALRYRVTAISTLTGTVVPQGSADLRVLNSPLQTVTLTDSSTVSAQALTLQTPAAQANGGGLNSSLAEGVITTTAPLANGASTFVEFNLGVQQFGQVRFAVQAEALNVNLQGVSGYLDLGGSVTADTLTIAPFGAPMITSDNHTTFQTGVNGSFTLMATGTPAPTLGQTGILPNDVTFDSSTGSLSGTPAVGTGGVYSIIFTATIGGNVASQSFTLTVQEAPTISSANATTFQVGQLGSFTVATNHSYPTARTVTHTGALPTGVSLTDNDDGTATLTGTPAAGTGGVYPITIMSSNGTGTDASQSFTLTVNELPSISSANNTSFQYATQSSFTVMTSGGYPTPPALSLTGTLPGGLNFTDNMDGTATLSGKPSGGANVYMVTIKADNGVGTGVTQNFTLTVTQPPAINDFAFTAGTKVVTIDVLANDSAMSGATLSIVTQPTHGTATVVGGKIVYTPKGALPAGGDSFTYQYDDGKGGMSMATVTIGNFGAIAGDYDGLIMANPAGDGQARHDQGGYLRLSVTKTGSYSATLTLGGVTFSAQPSVGYRNFVFRGQLDTTGGFTHQSLRAPAAAVDLALQYVQGSGIIQGTVASTDSGAHAFTSTLALGKKTASGALAHNYTLMIDPDSTPGSPTGTGYAAVFLRANGNVQLVGRVADGSVISSTTYFHGDKSFPIYQSLYLGTFAKRGSLRGTVSFPLVPLLLGDASGSVEWFKPARSTDTLFPAGFAVARNVLAARYTPPAGGKAELAGAGLGDLVFTDVDAYSFDQAFKLTSANTATISLPNPAKVTLVFNVQGGLFLGKFTNPTTSTPALFYGAVFQADQSGSGFFLDVPKHAVGSVELTEK